MWRRNLLIKKIDFPENSFFLITGGAGFIGSNLAEAIINTGNRVRILDNFSSGKKENIKEYIGNEKVEIIGGDIRDYDTCMDACKGIDFVLHHAALASVEASIKDPQMANEINVNGMLNMLISANKNNVKRFIYASSSAVYGDNNSKQKSEEEKGVLLSPYAVTKKANEYYAQNFNALFGLRTIGLRYFNIFGPKQDPESEYSAVIPKFINKFLSGNIPVVDGDGMQTRDFVYIENVINANMIACTSGINACGQNYNIGCGKGITIKELFTIICDLLGIKAEPIFGKAREGDIRHSISDIKKARKFLSYTPQVDIYEGLKRTIDWYKNNQSKE